MNEVLQRIEIVLEHYGSTKTTLAKKIGMAQSTLSSQFLRNMTPSDYLIDAIIEIYADVRKEWLIRGEEPMLRSQMLDDGTNKLINIISELTETIRQQEQTITRLTKP